MTTFNTGNPIGSTDARDRLDNTENLDLAVNSLSQTFVDRLGRTRDTLEGIYQKSAYYRAGTFDAGYTLTNNRQTLAYGNIEYSWSGAFPKVVSAGSTPAASGGVGAGAWVDRTQETVIALLNILTKTFNSISDAIADNSLIVGQKVKTISYFDGWAATALGLPKGGNDYIVVAGGTGVADGGSFIDTASGLQLKALFQNGKSFFHFGAVNDPLIDNSTAIQNCINSGGAIIVDGVFKTDSQITLVSNLKLKFKPGAKLSPSNLVALSAYYGNGVTKVKIIDAVVEGTGDAYTNGNQRLFQFDSCSKIKFIDPEISKSRADGIVFDACSDVHLVRGDLHNNYQTGVTFRNGSSKIKVTDTESYGNGNTGTAVAPSGVGGRGMLFWQCSNFSVTGGAIYDNTEYGIRLYSQTGDTEGNRAGSISGTQIRNNGTATGIDLYIYDESGLTERISVSGLVISTKASGTAMALSGKNITAKGCISVAISPYASNTGVSLYGGTNVLVEGNIFNGFASGLQLSDSVGHVTTKCKVIYNTFDGVQTPINGMLGVDNEIIGNTFTHGGVGTTDVGCDITKTSVSGKLHDNIFDGFYRGINLAALTPNVSIKRNKTKNSSGSGVFAQYQSTLIGLTFADNDFDSAYPEIFATLQKRSNGRFDRAEFLCAAQPASSITTGSNITWSVGDRGVRSNPSVGAVKSWVCTVAGSPGTWVSEGVL